MKAGRLRAVLERKPLNYRMTRQTGSPRRLLSPDYPPLAIADTYEEIVELIEDGIPFALERVVELEHVLPAGANRAA